MANVSAVDLMKLSLSLESKKLEVASKNLANINKTYASSKDVPGKFYLKVQELPSIHDVILGTGPSVDYSIETDRSNVLTSNNSGYLEYSVNIRLEEQVLDVSQAKNTYEASIRLFNNSKDMSRKIMSIGNK
ncbi:hypothetical protein [Vibrio coralliilyticus]|uniref:Flagellar basal body rod protein FlgB n=1 Tax=Vibrio coralliilyticus TaxID=190893 RepID=A0AAP6ZKH7_9VIBR|nr:hypothetical protein [Vibrio coralliilyticus]NOJ23566.1 hypothetical protein [Vibrio coralliilyticus]